MICKLERASFLAKLLFSEMKCNTLEKNAAELIGSDNTIVPHLRVSGAGGPKRLARVYR